MFLKRSFYVDAVPYPTRTATVCLATWFPYIWHILSLRSLCDQLRMSVCPSVKISIHSYITCWSVCWSMRIEVHTAMVFFTCSFNLQLYWSLSLLTEPFINIDLLGNSFVIHVGWYTCAFCIIFNNTIKQKSVQIEVFWNRIWFDLFWCI